MKSITLKRLNLIKSLFMVILFLSISQINAQSCASLSSLYQTIGINAPNGRAGYGKTGIYKFNKSNLKFELQTTLTGVSELAASSSAFNKTTGLLYVAEKPGTSKVVKVYNPANNFSYVGSITVTGLGTIDFSNNLFSEGDYIGFRENAKMLQFKVTNINRYPANVVASVVNIPNHNVNTICADYVRYKGSLYGIATKNVSDSNCYLVIINSSGVLTTRRLTSPNVIVNASGLGFGATWIDANGNFMVFQNETGAIYRIDNVAVDSSNTFKKILVTNASTKNDGFGCEDLEDIFAPETPIVNVTAPTCSQSGTSTITNYKANITYAFAPSGPIVNNSGLINGLIIGTSYTVTANNGISTSVASASFSNVAQLASPIPLTLTGSTICTAPGGNGIITSSTSVSGVSYQLYNSNNANVQAAKYGTGLTLTWTNLLAGNGYYVIATNNGCIATSNVVDVLNSNSNSIPTISSTPATCSVAGKSTINNYNALNVYTFTPLGPTVGGTGLISGMTIGTSYTVTSANGGCTSASSASFSNAAMLVTPVVPTVSSITATCSTAGTSTISNYTGSNTYTFTPLGPTVGATGLIAGMIIGTSYTVTSTNGVCTSAPSIAFSNTAMLVTPVVPTISSITATCFATGTSTITNYNAANVYSFTPSGPTVGATGLISGMTIGTTYTVTLANGICTSASSASFSNAAILESPIVDVGTSFTKTCTVNPTGKQIGMTAVAGTTYVWTPMTGLSDATASNPIANPTATTTYTLTATNAISGCTGADSVTVTVDTLNCPNTYTLIPDANFERKLIVLGIDSGAVDGRVLTSSINTITDLKVSYNSIIDLTGIEDFTSLKVLDCSGNKLINLDISKNIALEELKCSSNQLVNLDTSKNIVLKIFECNSNKLTNLDVSKNVALTWFYCDSNQLTSLDVSKNIVLDDFYCNGNRLTNLDLSHNPVLISLYCENNLLSSLDISQNPALVILVCPNNQLTNLDVSKNTVLQLLNCSYNQITAIDITKNIALTSFQCNNNRLLNLNLKNGKNSLAAHYDFKNNPDLTCIQVDDEAYSNANWANLKDATARYSTNCEAANSCTLIPDENFERKLIALGIDFGEIDGKVSTLNISTLTTLNVSSSSIANLTGIQDFIALKSLSCYNNQLTSLDVSKNLALKSLICYSNQLTFLDISKNRALTSFYCNDNMLTSLDVSKNAVLTELYCYSNQLTSLDVSKNIALTELYCFQNRLTNLDVSNNATLKQLECGLNQMTNLDVTNNINLEYLECYSNQLKVIDVFKNIKLNHLNCESNQIKNLNVSKNTRLKELYCSNNLLAILDVSSNASLTNLGCNANNLINLNLKNGSNTSLIKTDLNFKNNPNLSCIQVDDVTYSNTNWLSAKDATASYSVNCGIINQYTLIPDANFERKLIVLGIDLGVVDGKVLTSNINTITDLNVSYSSIIDLTGIENFTNLKTLECSGNKLINLDISKNIALEELECNNNQLVSLDVSKNIALKIFECNENKLINLDVTKNIALTWFYCYSNQLTSLDVSKNIVLDDFYCSRNRLTNLDVSHNPALISLYCEKNLLPSLDISQNPALVILVCPYNQITNLDVAKNTVLQLLDCSYNQITAIDITKNIALTSLRCNNNNKLFNLNLKNGNNILLLRYIRYTDFKNNPNLICIQVDDETYSNANWAAAKDATASYSTNCGTTNLYTLMPDENFERKLIALGIDSGVVDGKVLTSRIDAITSLNVSSSSIANLTGIQDFVALTYLNCISNQLTSLDVSKNTVLKSLYCYNNQLTNLDVSKNVVLRVLDCERNQLTNLDVSKNIILETLYCTGNLLANLDVSKNINLIELQCYSNKLVSLDVSKNIALTVLYCLQNQLTNLDVSKNLALSDFWCSHNYLTSLDVSKNINLYDLECNSNQLTSLDVSKNIALIYLGCYQNELINLDVSKNSFLTSFNCSTNKLLNLDLKNGKNTNLDITILKLGNNPNLTCIQVDDEAYSNANWSSAKDAIANYSTNCGSSSRIVNAVTEENVFDKIALYPNPVKGELHIDNIVLKNARIYDVFGKLIKSASFNSVANANTIDLTGMKRGVYYIYLDSDAGNTNKKIIVE